MARIAIIGPGAVGGVMAAQLGHTGRHTLFLCARQPLTQLVVETPDGILSGHPTVLIDPSTAPPVDWILVVTKAYDATGAAAWFPALGAEGAPVAVLQNGVEHRERFATHLPGDRILPVVVDCPAERSAPGKIRQRGRALLVVPDTTTGQMFAGLFTGTPVTLTLTSDFPSAAWRKLCINAAGVLSALLLQPAGVMRGEEVGEIARQIVRECIAVGRAEGAAIDDSWVETVLAGYRQAPPDSVNSLHADHQNGRPTEIDARNGVIVRLGRKHGIATPCNQMAVALLQAMHVRSV